MIQSSPNNVSKFFSGLTFLYPENDFLKNLYLALSKYPEMINEDWLSKGQIQSKQWLINELDKYSLNLGIVYLTPGWYGLLASLISESKLSFSLIRSFDIDQKAIKISELLNHSLLINDWRFKGTSCDIFEINYSNNHYVTFKHNSDPVQLIESPDTIINTACEHIDYVKWLDLVPKDKLLVLQNNNNRSVDSHLFCVDSCDEFRTKCNLSEYLFAGTLKLDGYDRYMLIGRK